MRKSHLIFESSISISEKPDIAQVIALHRCAVALSDRVGEPGQSFSVLSFVKSLEIDPSIYTSSLMRSFVTLVYNLALHSGAEILERHPSPNAPEEQLGREACITPEGGDLIFRNVLSTPICFRIAIFPETMTGKVEGAPPPWAMLSIETEDARLSSSPILCERADLPSFKVGRVGREVRLWRKILFEDGSLKEEMLGQHTYPATQTVIRSPSGDVSGVLPIFPLTVYV